MDETVLREVLANPDYQLLTRVPTAYTAKTGEHSKRFIVTIIDLETMGLDPKQHEIIEIGLLSFSFSNDAGILAVINSYNELNDPGRAIPVKSVNCCKFEMAH